ncbi:unnamed protein product [Ixodes pacificus]
MSPHKMIQRSTSFEPSCPENLLRRGYSSSQKANKRYHSLHGTHGASGSHQNCFMTASGSSCRLRPEAGTTLHPHIRASERSSCSFGSQQDA